MKFAVSFWLFLDSPLIPTIVPPYIHQSSFSFHEPPKEKESKRKPTPDCYSQFEAMQNYRTSQQCKGFINGLL